MKTPFYIIWFFVLLFAGNLSAQNVLKVNPAGLLLNTGSASFERFINDNWSAQADAMLHSAEVEGLQFSGFGVGLSLRYYLSERVRPGGLFVAPGAIFHFLSFEDIQRIDHDYSLPGLWLQLGHQWVLGGVLTLELGVGGQYGFLSEIPNSPSTDAYFGDGFFPFGNIGLGVTF
ncbi:MAG TPA: DUF3575 domain-containing protein [Saprospiraceae bacterium]|nr:DUF3575 domain-containing protein [Saprospiraceae bacterium]HMQ83515.1 DUF3575 domain-containing protein [Saprospiraceae bacterium]